MFLAVLPAGGFNALQAEIRRANIELLLLTKLSRWRVILGKWSMLSAQSLLVFSSLLPYLVTRYFFGGVDLIQSFYLGALLLVLNAAANAIVIGASAYAPLPLRLWMIAYQAGSALVCLGIVVGGSAAIAGIVASATGHAGFIATWVVSCSVLLVAFLYILFGLQIGRGRIKLFTSAFDTPESGVVSILLFAAPIFIGMVTVVTVGFGAIPATGVLCWAAWKLDSAKGEAESTQIASAKSLVG